MVTYIGRTYVLIRGPTNIRIQRCGACNYSMSAVHDVLFLYF